MILRLKILLALIAFLLIPVASLSQTTSVSGTITDAGGVVWKNGTFSFSFTPSPGNPTAQYFQNGVPFNKSTTISGSLDATGSLTSVAVPDNLTIVPSGSTWATQVCPAATATCFKVQLTITGVSQSITSAVVPPAVVVTVINPGFYAAYTDGEISGGRQGSIYFNLSDATLHICNLPVCTWLSLASPASILGLNNAFTGNNAFLNDIFIGAANPPTNSNCGFHFETFPGSGVGSAVVVSAPTTIFPFGCDTVYRHDGPSDNNWAITSVRATTAASITGGSANTNVLISSVCNFNSFFGGNQGPCGGTSSFAQTSGQQLIIGRTISGLVFGVAGALDTMTWSGGSGCATAHTWGVVDATHLCLNPTNSYSGTTDIEQGPGITFVHDWVWQMHGDATKPAQQTASNPGLAIEDKNGTPYFTFPSDLTTTAPNNSINVKAPLTVSGTGTFNSILALPNTTSSSVGVVTFGGTPFMHDFGTQNVFVGSGAGNFTLTGTQNNGFGLGVLSAVTTGTGNNGVGVHALLSNTTGIGNDAFGGFALALNTTGNNNSAFGDGALEANTTGIQNSAFGSQALTANTTANNNSAFGIQALASLVGGTATNDSAFGVTACKSLTTGSSNGCFGLDALRNLTTGSGNIAVGAGVGGGSGANYTSSESNNIVIGNLGTLGESGIIRIGTPGTHTATFLSGILAVNNGLATGSVAGDVDASRSATSGAVFLGTDGNSQLFRSGNTGSFQYGTATATFPAATGVLTQTVGSGTVTTAGTAIGAGTSQAQTGITVTGATVTDVAQCALNASPPATWQTGIQLLPPIVTANTVTVWLSNPTAGSITPAAATVRCTVTR